MVSCDVVFVFLDAFMCSTTCQHPTASMTYKVQRVSHRISKLADCFEFQNIFRAKTHLRRQIKKNKKNKNKTKPGQFFIKYHLLSSQPFSIKLLAIFLYLLACISQNLIYLFSKIKQNLGNFSSYIIYYHHNHFP